MEELEKEETTTAITEEAALLKEYKKLQENSVSKEKYDADMKELRDKNELYLKAITEGGKVDTPRDDSGSIEDAIAELSKFKGTNLDYWQKMTSAIDKTLQSIPEREITNSIGSDGLEELIKVNEGMKQMVEDANGDADYFRTLYNHRVKDSAPRISAQIEKAGGVGNYFIEQQKSHK